MSMIISQKTMNQFTDFTWNVTAAGGLGALGAHLFTAIPPLHGAAFAATAMLVSKVLMPVFESLFFREGANQTSLLFGTTLSLAVGIAASTAITTAFGMPITFATGVTLAISTIAVSIIFNICGCKVIEDELNPLSPLKRN